MICTDISCRRVVSAEEAFNLTFKSSLNISIKELEISDVPIKTCPCCTSPLTLYTPVKSLIEYLKYLFAQNAYGAFAIDANGEIAGESITFKAPLSGAFLSLNYRGGYSLEVFKRIIEDKTGNKVSDDDEFICSNRIATSRQQRRKGIYSQLLRANLNIYPEHDTYPGIGDTKINTKLLPLVLASGYETLEIDHTGGIGLYTERFGMFRKIVNQERKEFLQQNGPEISSGKKRTSFIN